MLLKETVSQLLFKTVYERLHGCVCVCLRWSGAHQAGLSEGPFVGHCLSLSGRSPHKCAHLCACAHQESIGMLLADIGVHCAL